MSRKGKWEEERKHRQPSNRFSVCGRFLERHRRDAEMADSNAARKVLRHAGKGGGIGCRWLLQLEKPVEKFGTDAEGLNQPR